ncbi:MAG: hypothetical protein FWD16_08295 [Clostridia bacterium]|nr:hypothetical protein [Clostridia bacterium]
MVSPTSNDFLTLRDWHEAVVGGQDVILRHTSALEHLELFVGYVREKTIDVYARQPGRFDNVNYYLVDTFDGIETIRLGDVRCTSVNQTINDMLGDFENIDEQSLVEALSRYYYSHNKSFQGLVISSENAALFNSVKDWAIEYYDEA